MIRLNIEPPVATPPQAEPPPAAPGASGQKASKASDGPAAPAAGQMFSEAYLKEEFPRFYDNSPEAQKAAEEQARAADPAFQLQDFLNSQGQQG